MISDTTPFRLGMQDAILWMAMTAIAGFFLGWVFGSLVMHDYCDSRVEAIYQMHGWKGRG